MRICFDMDGTIADLYGVENWLNYLISENVAPYREAKTLINMSVLARYLNRAQRNGNEIVVISWTSKNGSDAYNAAVAQVKREWLKRHLPSVKWDEINIVEYGYNKANFVKNSNDILFDDEAQNRENWTGKAYDEKNILKILKNF